MGPSPSYYDSVGLLAICDAIDTVDGIPFHPIAEPKPIPSFRETRTVTRLPSSADDFGAEHSRNAVPQHILLAHIPVTGVFSPFGTISYEEEHRMAINELANTGQLPQQAPAHTIGGIRPSVPVAHNLHGNSGQRSRSTSMPQSPAHVGRLATPAAQTAPSNLSGMSNTTLAGKMRVPMQASSSTPLTARSESPSVAAPVLNSPSVPPQVSQPPTMVPGITGQSGFDSVSSMTPTVLPPNPMAESRASTPASPMESPHAQYRVEVCQICGRDFKGRKAATHKQQHIRRLHPAEYTPKRGGKKSRVD